MSSAPKTARGTLTGRITALAVGIALVTGILAGALAIGLIRSADQSSARRTLGHLADAAQTSIDHSAAGAVAQTRAKRVLGVLGVRYGSFGPSGRVTGDPLAVDAMTSSYLVTLRSGGSISATRTVDGRKVFIEGRATNSAGFLLVQPRSDATAGGSAAIRRTIIAILIGVGVAAVGGGLVARRLARPLRRTAAAAHAMALGRRDVVLTPEGPAEVAEVAEAITTLNGALAQSEGRQREFLMSVSHDLRTPLTAITGYAESLAEGVVPESETAQVGTVMLNEARRLERLVGDLLDLARLDAADFRIEFATVDLTELARAAAPVWDQRCKSVGVQFFLEIPAGPVPVVTDAARVRQMLDGLMENALRVTPTSAPIVLAVRAEPDGRGCAEVRDGGPGLTDADLAVAFQRSELYRRYRGERQVGTGLGLAIVHGLAGRLGGSVEAGHAREGGARFTVRLPGVPRA